MSRLDEIAARDAASDEGIRPNWTLEQHAGQCAADRRYLLGLVREAREALRTAYLELVQDVDPDAVMVRLGDAAHRLTEGSDRT